MASGKNLLLRPVEADDGEFLFELYSSTRRTETAEFGWEETAVDAFLRMQFNAREKVYGLQFSGADDNVIFKDDLPVGRMIIYRTDDEISLVDIAILPESRGKGIGTRLIGQLKDEAARASKPIQLKVDRTNAAARKLYEMRGFYVLSETAISILMEWKPLPA